MLEKLDAFEQEALEALEQARQPEQLQRWKTRYLGKSTALTEAMESIPSLEPDQRPLVGRRVNEIKGKLQSRMEDRAEAIRAQEVARSLEEESVDVTLPGRPVQRGRLHPTTQVLREIVDIWAELGFQVYRSGEVETDEYNFGLLNIPEHHPARDMWDTFYTTKPGVILRTHTSPGQIHVMRERAPEPIRVVLPGMCYRYEQITARSDIQFNQVEGLAIGRNITFADLKGTLIYFAERMFGVGVGTRFRASHFPFTEPSAELDIECFVCHGEGCSVCKRTGWLEILGCGMVHPKVLSNGGYDPTEFSGFAFGMGPERLKMLQHRIDDIRYFWANDLRFLEQF
ncbi:MAG: phenylalanine--tRNA ligase subunit alpha [Anaerolineales bacterium]